MKVRLSLIFSLLSLITALIWLIVFSFPNKNLKIIACDVGQGDAILAVYGSTQILIDGGPGKRVTDCLSKYIPFWDREVELVILTHPQADHYEGLIEVFREYKVNVFLANSLESSSQGYQVLKNEVGGSQARVINPERGMRIGIGMIYLDILSPSKEFLAENTEENLSLRGTKSDEAIFPKLNSSTDVLGVYTSSLDPNEFSIITRLSYKHFEALFAGDMENNLSDIISKDYTMAKGDTVKYIKIPHHGSKNGISKLLVEKMHPNVAVISVGKNSYGHPSGEVLKLLRDRDIKILRTDEIGDVVVETDGFTLQGPTL